MSTLTPFKAAQAKNNSWLKKSIKLPKCNGPLLKAIVNTCHQELSSENIDHGDPINIPPLQFPVAEALQKLKEQARNDENASLTFANLNDQNLNTFELSVSYCYDYLVLILTDFHYKKIQKELFTAMISKYIEQATSGDRPYSCFYQWMGSISSDGYMRCIIHLCQMYARQPQFQNMFCFFFPFIASLRIPSLLQQQLIAFEVDPKVWNQIMGKFIPNQYLYQNKKGYLFLEVDEDGILIKRQPQIIAIEDDDEGQSDFVEEQEEEVVQVQQKVQQKVPKTKRIKKDPKDQKNKAKGPIRANTIEEYAIFIQSGLQVDIQHMKLLVQQRAGENAVATTTTQENKSRSIMRPLNLSSLFDKNSDIGCINFCSFCKKQAGFIQQDSWELSAVKPWQTVTQSTNFFFRNWSFKPTKLTQKNSFIKTAFAGFVDTCGYCSPLLNRLAMNLDKHFQIFVKKYFTKQEHIKSLLEMHQVFKTLKRQPWINRTFFRSYIIAKTKKYQPNFGFQFVVPFGVQKFNQFCDLSQLIPCNEFATFFLDMKHGFCGAFPAGNPKEIDIVRPFNKIQEHFDDNWQSMVNNVNPLLQPQFLYKYAISCIVFLALRKTQSKGIIFGWNASKQQEVEDLFPTEKEENKMDEELINVQVNEDFY